uniref:Uncharacterized protein n=1 Tax=Aegilops tauschii subsp. strangulata TaxID=200361 RepID=A0A452XVT7_AEGTS
MWHSSKGFRLGRRPHTQGHEEGKEGSRGVQQAATRQDFALYGILPETCTRSFTGKQASQATTRAHYKTVREIKEMRANTTGGNFAPTTSNGEKKITLLSLDLFFGCRVVDQFLQFSTSNGLAIAGPSDWVEPGEGIHCLCPPFA